MRTVWESPSSHWFGPRDQAGETEDEIVMTIDELEAIRFKDHLKLSQREVAERMNLSQPTLHRLLCYARGKLADVLINAKNLRIVEDEYAVQVKKYSLKYQCPRCQHEEEIFSQRGPTELECPVCREKGLKIVGGQKDC